MLGRRVRDNKLICNVPVVFFIHPYPVRRADITRQQRIFIVTDEGNIIYDCAFGPIKDAEELAADRIARGREIRGDLTADVEALLAAPAETRAGETLSDDGFFETTLETGVVAGQERSVVALMGDIVLGQTDPLVVEPGLADELQSSLSLERTSLPADGASTVLLTLEAKDGKLVGRWTWTGENPVRRAELVVTYGRVQPWHEWVYRYYHTIPAVIDGQSASAQVPVPEPGLELLAFGNIHGRISQAVRHEKKVAARLDVGHLEKIGEAEHDRFIIDEDRFLQRVEEKRNAG